MKEKWFKVFLDYIGITLGTFLMALSLLMFLEPNTIAPGGVTGLAIVIQKVSGIPMDVTNLAINIPLFIIGLMVLGKAFGAKTAYGTASLSIFIRILIVIFGNNINATGDLLLASIFGGVAVGIGIGIVFKSGATTGGTDLAGAILNKYIPGLSIPKLMMIIDLVIVAAAGIVNRNIETSLYSIISLYILVKVADFIVEGLNYSKAFYIITEYSEEISKEVFVQLARGATALKGKGMYTGEDKDVLLCVVNRAQVTKLKNIVYAIDKQAFIMVTTIHEVLGEGFTPMNKK
ncbi:YitT family protein [Wukongibacter baidiensis]|uniref:YitT family protein n=1 Tax=Wukongibacter baidiensis TaxID=1723361 RepID=UPI003D7FA6F5